MPIIFIGHSLGGLVVKSALLHSNMGKPGNLERQTAIKLSTYGILFLGTPHQGGEGVDRLKILVSLLSHFTQTNHKIIDRIMPNSEWLQEHQSAYNSISQEFETVFFYETWKMPICVGPVCYEQIVTFLRSITPAIVITEQKHFEANISDRWFLNTPQSFRAHLTRSP